MANLSSDLQASIDALGTQHTNLVQAIRNYKDGSVASATNELLAVANTTASSIAAKESSLLGLINSINPGTQPSLLLDFANKVYMRGTRGLEEGKELYSWLNVTRDSEAGYWDASGNFVLAAPDELRFQYEGDTGKAAGVLIESYALNLVVDSSDANLWGRYGGGAVITDAGIHSGVQFWEIDDQADGSEGNDTRGTVHSIDAPANIHFTRSFLIRRGGTASETVFSSQGVGVDASPNLHISWDSNGPVVSASSSVVDWGIIPRGNNIWELWYCFRTNSNGGTVANYTFPANFGTGADKTGSVIIAHPMIWQGRGFSTYVETDSSPRSRPGDGIRLNLTGELNRSEGTMYFEYDPTLPAISSGGAVSWLAKVNETNTSYGERFQIAFTTDSKGVIFYYVSENDSWSRNRNCANGKVVMSWKVGERLTVTGMHYESGDDPSTAAPSTSGWPVGGSDFSTLPWLSLLEQINLGSFQGLNGARALGSTLKKFALYPTALDRDTMEDMVRD